MTQDTKIMNKELPSKIKVRGKDPNTLKTMCFLNHEYEVSIKIQTQFYKINLGQCLNRSTDMPDTIAPKTCTATRDTGERQIDG